MPSTLASLGEREVISRITKLIPNQPELYGGIGHDAGFLDIQLKEDEILAINTDRSGLNIATKYGLDNGKSVGDFGVSHAVSDLLASGANPVSVSIAMLLPPSTEITFIENVMHGIVEACQRYNLTITGGDTKKNNEFALVVTACGIAKKQNVIARNSSNADDLLVVTGYLGSFLLGVFANKNNLNLKPEINNIITKSLVEQRPPYHLSMQINKTGLVNAATDISDGLPAAIYNICEPSGLGCVIYNDKIPINPELISLQEQSKLTNIDLSSGGGDWEFLYAISKESFNALVALIPEAKNHLHIIGHTTKTNTFFVNIGKQKYELVNNENDSFKKTINGNGHFTRILNGESTAIGKKVF